MSDDRRKLLGRSLDWAKHTYMTAQDSVKEKTQTVRDTVKDKTQTVRDTVEDKTQTFSGKKIEETLDDYSKTYGEVLVGVHGDIKAQERRLESQQHELKALRARVTELEQSGSPPSKLVNTSHDRSPIDERGSVAKLNKKLHSLKEHIKVAYVIGIAALLLGIVQLLID